MPLRKSTGVVVGQAVGDLNHPGQLWISVWNTTALPAARSNPIVADLALLHKLLQAFKKRLIEVRGLTFVEKILIDVACSQLAEARFDLIAQHSV